MTLTALWNREPALILGALGALLSLGLAFGLSITPAQIGAIMAAASALIAVITRQTVTSPTTLQNLTPGTLAAAQDAAQPVKETIRKLPVVVLACVLAGSAVGCAKAPPNLTPQATTAFYGTRVIQTLDVIRDLAVSASRQTPPVVKPADLRLIVTWHRAAIVTVHTAPAGWRVTVGTGLDETLRSLPPETRRLLAPYVALVKTVLAEVGSGTHDDAFTRVDTMGAVARQPYRIDQSGE